MLSAIFTFLLKGKSQKQRLIIALVLNDSSLGKQ
jgi:hypothetical protein